MLITLGIVIEAVVDESLEEEEAISKDEIQFTESDS